MFLQPKSDMSIASMVSVIIPFFNAEKFLQQTIESVCAQTFTHWEMLLIDDGSTDHSSRIARQCEEANPGRVRYLEHADHQNRGVCASRNLGIRKSNGNYLAFLDADDVWLPHKLEQQIAIMTAQPEAGMLYGASQYWHSWTGLRSDMDRDDVPELGVALDTMIHPPLLLTLYLASQARTPCPSDIMLRREIVEAVGGFEENFHGMNQLYEDQAFLAKVYLKSPVFVAGNCWDRYRQHENSCVALVTEAGLKYKTGLFYLEWLERYLRRGGIKDREVWRALRTKRRRYRYPNFSPLLERVQFRMEQVKKLAGAMLHSALPVGAQYRKVSRRKERKY
jgi:glycosyltransferase involved in cell wall biosynthesis